MATHRSKTLYRYRLTRLGYHFLFIALFAVIGGSLRGFNLLLVLAGLLIAVIIVQWRQCRAMIRRTRLRRISTRGSFAGTPIKIGYEVANQGRWLPLWNIQIDDRVSAKVVPPHLQRDVDEEMGGSSNPISLTSSVGQVPPRQTRAISSHCRFHHRGLYKLGPAVTSTMYPFCLMTAQRLGTGTQDQIFIYPQPLQLRRGWSDVLPPKRGGDGSRSTGGTKHDGEFFGLRPWQSGDHVKHIHWRTTARIGEPAVRQFEQRNRHQVCVVVDCSLKSSDDRASEAIELVLRLATTLIGELSTRNRSVTMLIADANSAASSADPKLIHSEGNQMTTLLERLAVAIPHRAPESDSLSRCISHVAPELRKYDLVVVSSRRLADVVSSSGESQAGKQVTAIWRFFDQAGRLCWLDVNSAAVDRLMHRDPAGDADANNQSQPAAGANVDATN